MSETEPEELRFRDLVAFRDREDMPEETVADVNVVLGANGAGKSRLLRKIKNWTQQNSESQRSNDRQQRDRSQERCDNLAKTLPFDPEEGKPSDIQLSDRKESRHENWKNHRESFCEADKRLEAREFLSVHGVEQGTVVHVKGGRAIQLPDTVRSAATLDEAESNYSFEEEFDSRLEKALSLLLSRNDAYLKGLGSQTQEAQERGNFSELQTEPEETELQKTTRLFGEVISNISIHIDEKNQSIVAEKEGETYAGNAMSDGEKQVFSLITDVVTAGESARLFIVDEPELNLNSYLACRLWDVFEAEYPEATFIYATHDVGFAARSNVEKILVLGGSEKPPILKENLGAIPHEQLIRFLGAVPAVLYSNRALFIEGDDESFDTLFYGWLLEDMDIRLIPAESCGEVKKAVLGAGVWDELASRTAIGGVIDRDYRSEDKLDSYRDAGVVTLDLHEAESYLCEPEVFCEIIRPSWERSGAAEPPPTEDEVRGWIRAHFEDQMEATVARRVNQRYKMNFNVSLSGGEYDGLSETDLANRFEAKAEATLREMEDEHGPDRAREIVEQQFERCREALQNDDLHEMLRLTAGKQLLGHLIGETGGRGPRKKSEFARAAATHVEVQDHDFLQNLKGQIQGRIEP